MTRRTPTGAFKDALGHWRRPDGRFASQRSIVALKGWETRRRKQKAKVLEIRKRTAAAKHGQRARQRTEARLTEQQRAARHRDADRIEQKERRARKKAARRADAAPFRRSPSSPHSRKRTTGSRRKPRPISSPIRTRVHKFTFDQGGSGDELKVQIAVRFNMEAPPNNRLAYEAILHRIDRDDDADRVQTRIIRWRNPGRKRGELRDWRQGNQEDAWTTLGPAIRAAILRAYPDLDLTV